MVGNAPYPHQTKITLIQLQVQQTGTLLDCVAMTVCTTHRHRHTRTLLDCSMTVCTTHRHRNTWTLLDCSMTVCTTHRHRHTWTLLDCSMTVCTTHRHRHTWTLLDCSNDSVHYTPTQTHMDSARL